MSVPLPEVPHPVGDPVPAPPVRGVLWAGAAVLLRYPDGDLVAALAPIQAALRDIAAEADPAATAALTRAVGWLGARSLLAAQQHYVSTFDTRRRCCPYLTYYLHGDTRRRGLALWRVSAALRGCGLEPTGGELPDHLAVLCELAATGDESVAVTLLVEHRTGLALLRAALERAGSGYADVVEAVEALLPPAAGTPSGAAEEAVARLGLTGPPAELVGMPGRLAPFLPHPAGRVAGESDDRGVRR